MRSSEYNQMLNSYSSPFLLAASAGSLAGSGKLSALLEGPASASASALTSSGPEAEGSGASSVSAWASGGGEAAGSSAGKNVTLGFSVKQPLLYLLEALCMLVMRPGKKN